MTHLEKAIFNEIKDHLEEEGREYLKDYKNGIKFLDMGRYIKENYQEFSVLHGGKYTMIKYKVRTLFKPEIKYANNCVDWMVNIYSDGTMGIYFDGTEYIQK